MQNKTSLFLSLSNRSFDENNTKQQPITRREVTPSANLSRTRSPSLDKSHRSHLTELVLPVSGLARWLARSLPGSSCSRVWTPRQVVLCEPEREPRVIPAIPLCSSAGPRCHSGSGRVGCYALGQRGSSGVLQQLRCGGDRLFVIDHNYYFFHLAHFFFVSPLFHFVFSFLFLFF